MEKKCTGGYNRRSDVGLVLRDMGEISLVYRGDIWCKCEARLLTPASTASKRTVPDGVQLRR